MTPSKFRKGGTDTDILFAIGECSLGSILVAQSKKGVCSILIGDDPQLLVRDRQDRFPKAKLIGDESNYQELIAKIVGLIEKPGVGLGLPLDIRGTAFQQRVWKALQQIPPGSTATYSEIAAKIGMPKAARAVARLAAQIPWRSPFRVTESSETMDRSPAIVGEWSGSVCFSKERHTNENLVRG